MLIRPIITEKSTRAASRKIYTFEVSKDDTKTQIKYLVEKTFGVKVLAVKTAMMAGKDYRTGRKGKKSYRSDWKKAMIEIKSDQKIDLFEAATEEVKK